MAYPALKLITRAFNLAQIVSPQFEVLDAFQASLGLDLLNEDVLATTTVEPRVISYFTEFNFNFVAGQESYFIPGLISIETLTFSIGDVRYSMYYEKRKKYFGSPRVNSISSLPYKWHEERELGGCRIFIYFIPDSAYPAQLYGKFRLADVTLNQDLSLSLDDFYISFLKYRLAERILEHYERPMIPAVALRIAEYYRNIKDFSPLDLSISKVSTFSGRPQPDYVNANLGRGWSPY
jgi:hypothetical protein